jgi:hypothetical protein
MKRKLALLTCLAVLGLGPARILACNVPVFRYALERWVPDNFVITTPAEPTNLVAALRSAPLNLSVESGSATNAAIYVPNAVADQPPLWSGAFTADNVRVLVDSPARREIVRQIQQGASAVWVLLESGNPAADAAAAKLLETELPKLTKELKIPEVDPDDPRTEGNVKLKIAFPMIRVSRTDPAEQLFIRMLLSGNVELDPAKGPIVFPVFGRGRALYGLAGKELTPANIGDVASFLCGACSCEVKEQNPGWDLLLAADWDALIDNPVVKDPELPPLISLSAMAASAQPQPAVARQPAPPTADNALSRNLLLVIAVVVLAAIAGTVIVKRKS